MFSPIWGLMIAIKGGSKGLRVAVLNGRTNCGRQMRYQPGKVKKVAKNSSGAPRNDVPPSYGTMNIFFVAGSFTLLPGA
jgi:hypothetical protein